MTVTDISVPGLNGIRQWEGRALRAYQDEVGVWTIGFGITNYDKNIGFRVGPGVTITAEQAEQLLYSSLRSNYMPAVERSIHLDSVAHQQGAMDGGLSFHYNTGGIARASWPSALNRGDLPSCRASLESWDKAGGRVLSGLVRRRAWEWGVISAENYGRMTGPEELNERERAIGTGELLTALPGHATPAVPPGNIHVDGPPAPSTAAPGALRPGATGPEVEDLQRSLEAAGYMIPVTGTFDAATEKAVRQFQGAHPQITEDGTVGPATKAALARTIALRQKTTTVVKSAPAAGGVIVGVWHWASAHAGEVMLVVTVAMALAVVGYLVWSYRHEARGVANKVLGRSVA